MLEGLGINVALEERKSLRKLVYRFILPYNRRIPVSFNFTLATTKLISKFKLKQAQNEQI